MNDYLRVDGKLYQSVEEALEDPKSVRRLTISLLDPDDYDGKKPAAPFPEGLDQLVNLQELNIAWNDLTEIPEVVFKLTSLVVLDISGNHLTEIPESIGKLKNLKELDMGDLYLLRNAEAERELIDHLLPDCHVRY